MSEPIRVPTMWRQATEDLQRLDPAAPARVIEIEAVICVKCAAMNRPGAILIRLTENGRCECSVCAHAWTPQ